MPFEEINVKNRVKEKLNTDFEFKQIYNETLEKFDIIKALIRTRKETGLSQKQLSEITGLRQQVISRIENDENSPTLKNLLKIAHGLNLGITVVPKKNKTPQSSALK